MPLWIGLCLPHLSLDVLRPTWLADAVGAHAVVEGGKIHSITRAAREAGVRIGMRRAGALAIAPGTLLTDRDPAREEAALADAALALLRFTPCVARIGSDALALDVSASLRLFGGLRPLMRQVRQSIEALGLAHRLSLAPTASGAWLLARTPGATPGATPGTGAGAASGSANASSAGSGGRFMRRRFARLESLARALDGMPFELLPQTRKTAEWIAGIGCRTLGDLRRLPRAGLKRRCGGELLDALDRAYGESPESFVWEEAPLVFVGRLELPDRVEHSDALLFSGRRLITQLTGWLAAQQKAVARFTLLLEHERGREAIEPTAVDVALAEAVWDPEHLTRLLKERLSRTTLAAPVIAVRLEARDVREMEQASESLFPDPGGKPGDFERLTDLLAARLGPENVLECAIAQDHRPEVANAWVPVGTAPRKASKASTSARKGIDPRGQRGPHGPTEANGTNATNGTNGASEANGTNGTNGTNGATGANGVNRANGPNTPAADGAALRAHEAQGARSRPDGLPDAQLPQRPFWLLETPVQLMTRNHRPFYGSPLRVSGKGERVEAGWWDDRLVTRDYFVGVGADHAQYWVFRERIGSQTDEDVRWFLHGLFA